MMTSKMIAIGGRCTVQNGPDLRERRGRVAGYATVEDQPAASFVGCSPARGPRLVVLVTLDEGFYNETRDVFSQTIVCDPSVVRAARDQGEPHVAVHGFSSQPEADRVTILLSPLHRQGIARLELDAVSAREWGIAITRRAEAIIEEQDRDAAERASLHRVAPLGGE